MAVIGFLFRGDFTAREEHDGIKTVECLRGRLIAERMASKTARAEADHMAKRLAELEKKLEEEMEHRGRAEKRLKQALKKLESLMILDFSSQLDLSDSSVSSSSPSKCFRSNGRLKKWKDLGQSGSSGSINSFTDSAHQRVSHDERWIPFGTESFLNKEDSQVDEACNSNGSLEFADGAASQSSKAKLHIEDNLTELPTKESLALVPVSIPQAQVACNPEVKKDVYAVLFSLRHVREQLQNIVRKVPQYYTKEPHGQRRTSTISMKTAPTK